MWNFSPRSWAENSGFDMAVYAFLILSPSSQGCKGLVDYKSHCLSEYFNEKAKAKK